MKRLMHPVRGIREPFGTAGLIVAIVALVAALAGGAYAASGGLTGKQKKEVEKIAKKYAGKPGAAGPAGTAGAKGDTGAKGADGAPGASGSNGSNGAPGTKGEKGETGFTSTLPSGKTETGTWGSAALLGANEFYPTPISFSIPLAQPSEHVVLLSEQETEESTAIPVQGCKLAAATAGTAAPVAPPATLCVFTLVEEEGSKPTKVAYSGLENTDGVVGSSVWVKSGPVVPGTGYGVNYAYGVWAVTAK